MCFKCLKNKFFNNGYLGKCQEKWKKISYKLSKAFAGMCVSVACEALNGNFHLRVSGNTLER